MISPSVDPQVVHEKYLSMIRHELPSMSSTQLTSYEVGWLYWQRFVLSDSCAINNK